MWVELSGFDKAMCYYDNSVTNGEIYGALYTWNAAMNGDTNSETNPSGIQGACPDGWHIPSDAEWKELEMNLGMSKEQADATNNRGTNEASKLAGNLSLWSIGSLTDDSFFGSSGFLALPAGSRPGGGSGEFQNLSESTSFWSTTDDPAFSTPIIRKLNYNNPKVVKWFEMGDNGNSVRCIKD